MLPDLGGLATFALTVVAAIIALRLMYLTVVSFFQPSLYVDATHAATGKDDVVPGIAELIESELAALREEGGGPSLSVMTSMDSAVDVGDIESAGGRLKEIGALLKLLPGRTRVLSSQLLASGARGEGLTVTLGTSTNRAAATTTIWADQFVRTDDLPADIAVDADDDPRATNEVRACLALAGAAWVAYQVLRNAPAVDRLGLLTQSWESYALFRVGARMQLLQLRSLARRLYVEALVRDPRNRGALFNLAILDFLEGNEPAAILRLKVVIDELEGNPLGDDRPWRFDRLWYRANYNVAAAQLNLAARTSKPLDPATTLPPLEELIGAADDTIRDLGGEAALMTGGRFADLVRFLVDVRSAAIVVYRDAMPATAG